MRLSKVEFGVAMSVHFQVIPCFLFTLYNEDVCSKVETKLWNAFKKTWRLIIFIITFIFNFFIVFAAVSRPKHGTGRNDESLTEGRISPLNKNFQTFSDEICFLININSNFKY